MTVSKFAISQFHFKLKEMVKWDKIPTVTATWQNFQELHSIHEYYWTHSLIFLYENDLGGAMKFSYP